MNNNFQAFSPQKDTTFSREPIHFNIFSFFFLLELLVDLINACWPTFCFINLSSQQFTTREGVKHSRCHRKAAFGWNIHVYKLLKKFRCGKRYSGLILQTSKFAWINRRDRVGTPSLKMQHTASQPRPKPLMCLKPGQVIWMQCCFGITWWHMWALCYGAKMTETK